MSIDPITGSPGLSVSFDSDYNETMLNNVLGLLGRFSGNRKLMVVFDEFQEIAEYKQEGFGKRLRAIIQKHENVSYFFCGSRRHILTEIFTNRNRAFYKKPEKNTQAYQSNRWQGYVLCKSFASR